MVVQPASLVTKTGFEGLSPLEPRPKMRWMPDTALATSSFSSSVRSPNMTMTSAPCSFRAFVISRAEPTMSGMILKSALSLFSAPQRVVAAKSVGEIMAKMPTFKSL